jgi:hypothetical protein
VSATDERPAESGTDATATGTTGPDEPDAPVDPERLLRAGETFETAVGVGRGWLAVTSHRLLVIDPDGGGKHLRAPNRLNVRDVRATAAGDGLTRDCNRGLRGPEPGRPGGRESGRTTGLLAETG